MREKKNQSGVEWMKQRRNAREQPNTYSVQERNKIRIDCGFN